MRLPETARLSKRYKLAYWLAAIGLSRRSVFLLFLFVLVFVAGSMAFLLTQESTGSLTWLSLITPLIILVPFLAYVAISPGMRRVMKQVEKEGKVRQVSGDLAMKEVVGKKMNIIMACWGTFIAIGIVLMTLLVMIGKEDRIEIVLYFHCTVGLILVFLMFWPFYSKRLKKHGEKEGEK